MSYTEAKSKINKIKETTSDYQASINSVQSSLLDFISEMNGHTKSISNGLEEKSLISFSSTSIKNIVSDINSALVESKQVLDKLSTDATDEIKRIVDAHNNSIDPESENPEPRLSYETISLASVDGITSESSPPPGGNGRRGGGGGDNYPPTPSSLEDYLALLGTQELDSSTIPNWDLYVKAFIEENNLSNSIVDITVKGNKIICKLTNGKEIEIENVTNTLDLLKAIKEKLTEN